MLPKGRIQTPSSMKRWRNAWRSNCSSSMTPMAPLTRTSRTPLDSRPNDSELHNKLGQTLERMGRLQDAETHFARAVAIAPAATGSTLAPEVAALLKRDPAGLITAVIQEESTGEVLMVGWMDDVALHRTLTTGRSTFFSRSRQEHWIKGETSGHRQWVREVRLDCDGDTVLVKVRQEGAACHTGDRTCFDSRPLSAVVAQQAEENER